jgi:putative ATPase
MTDPPSLFAPGAQRAQPLAARMRPERLEDFLGQLHLLGSGKPLRRAIETGDVGSMVLWGPPGCGKTTLARLIAAYTSRLFVPFSAVTEGIPRVREVIREAKERASMEGRGTILFCDEIHRFNRAQQDAFLPWVEDGTITLIGATTENPSFELNAALLSRLRVFVLEPLDAEVLADIVDRALIDLGTGGEGARPIVLADDAKHLVVQYADGDARKVLNAVEAVSEHVIREGVTTDASIDATTVREVLERRLPRYDKSGEEHFNLISALHKAVRGSDVEGTLYWLARMIDGGEDALYIARRLVRMAVEDVGLADPRALSVALAAKETYDFLGSPEGELALAQAAVYLATAPKSNRVYNAWGHAQHAAREHPSASVPLHIRNAPTGLMKSLGYGKGYQYDHDAPEGFAVEQEYLPEELRGVRWYEPSGLGFEKQIAERLAWWAERRKGS